MLGLFSSVRVKTRDSLSNSEIELLWEEIWSIADQFGVGRGA